MSGGAQTLLMYLVGSVPRPPSPAPLLGVKSLDFDPILDTAGLTAAGTLLPPALLSLQSHDPMGPVCSARHAWCMYTLLSGHMENLGHKCGLVEPCITLPFERFDSAPSWWCPCPFCPAQEGPCPAFIAPVDCQAMWPGNVHLSDKPC